MAARDLRQTHFPPDSRLVGFGLALVAILFMTISPLALVALGLSYDEAGGSPLEKVHPATILAFAVLGLSALYVRNPLTGLVNGLAHAPGAFFFLVTIALLITHSVRVVQLPFTSFIDTFIAPVVVFFLYKDLRDQRARRFAVLFHALMIANALVGIAEFAAGERITPLVASGLVIEDDWRSTALLGHPLANASLTGAYLFALALGAGRDLPRPVAVFAFVVSAAGMVVFGGRASSVILLIMLMGLGLTRLAGVLNGRRFDTRTILAALVALPILSLGLVVLVEAGFFDRFIERFFDDQGSASTRIEMFELFKHISWDELLFAPDAKQLATLRSLYGLDFGIESFWISFILNHGIVPGIVFFAGLVYFLREVVRHLLPGAAWVLVFFFAVASTSVSLSAKTPLLAVLILMLVVLLRISPQEESANSNDRAPAGRPHRHWATV